MEKLTEYNFNIEYRLEKKMEQADCLSRIGSAQVEANDKQYRTDATYVLIVTYNKEGIWMSEKYKAPMKGKLQTPCGKVEEGKTSWMAAVRELEEETGIKGPIMEYWGTDKQFNCDIYLYQLEAEDTMERMELEKNSEWRLFTLEEYRTLARQKECMDSHNKYFGNIINTIKEKETAQVFNIGRDKFIKKRKQQDEQEEVYTCRNCNHQYPKAHRHNCQRGLRPREKEQLRWRYRRRGHNANMRNMEFNERITQQDTKLRRYDNHKKKLSHR